MRAFIVFPFGLCLLFLTSNTTFAQPPKIVHLAHFGDRISVAFSPDSKTLATGGGDNHLRFWDVATGKQQRAIKAHNGPAGISRIAYFPDGKSLASSGWAGDDVGVKVWDIAKGTETLAIGKNAGGVSVLVISPDGKYLAWDARPIAIYDVKAGRLARSVTALGAVDSAAFSADSKYLATAHGTGKVHLWEGPTGKPIREILAAQSTATGSQAVAFSPDGKILATASRQPRLWNVATGEEIVALGPIGAQFCVAISPNGKLLASGAMGGPLQLWDMKSHKLVHSWNEVAVSVAFSPDSNWLAFGDRQNGGACIVNIAMLGK